MIVKIDELPAAYAPNSRTISVTSEWLKPLPPDEAEEVPFTTVDPVDPDDPWDSIGTPPEDDDEPPF